MSLSAEVILRDQQDLIQRHREDAAIMGFRNGFAAGMVSTAIVALVTIYVVRWASS